MATEPYTARVFVKLYRAGEFFMSDEMDVGQVDEEDAHIGSLRRATDEIKATVLACFGDQLLPSQVAKVQRQLIDSLQGRKWDA